MGISQWMTSAWTSALANLKITFSFALTVIWYLTIIGLLCAWRNGLFVLFMLAGTAAGWVAGILLAPYDAEQKHFASVSKGISGLISGYLLGKFDKVYDLVTDKSSGTPIILEPVFVRSLILCLGCFLVSAIAVFVARTYWQSEEGE